MTSPAERQAQRVSAAGGTRCPHCGHAWNAHTKDEGCYVGWRLAFDLNSGGDGCACRLAHADLSPETASDAV